MTFWRQLLLVAGKELLHLRRDPYTLVLTVALPLVQFLLFGMRSTRGYMMYPRPFRTSTVNASAGT